MNFNEPGFVYSGSFLKVSKSTEPVDSTQGIGVLLFLLNYFLRSQLQSDLCEVTQHFEALLKHESLKFAKEVS